MGKHILVLGSLNMDLSVGMKAMPKVGETILGDYLKYSAGGKGANQACAVGRLGGTVKMLGSIGKDDFGMAQKESLQKSGVLVSELKECEESTGTAIIYVNGEGDNSIVVIEGANKQCDIPYLEEREKEFEWMDYLLMQMEIPTKTIHYGAKKAKEKGKVVILNPAPAPDTMDLELLSMIDYLTPNETELAKLSQMPTDTLEQIQKASQSLLGKGVKKIIVTMGEKGSLLVDANGAKQFEAKKVQAIDTTAAGDCFNGAFVVGLAEGMTEEEAIRFATAASSIAVTRKGAQESIPYREEVK